MFNKTCDYCKKLIKNMETYMAFDKAYCSVKCRKSGVLMYNNLKDNEDKENEETYMQIKIKENIKKEENDKEKNKNIGILIHNKLINYNYQNYCNIF